MDQLISLLLGPAGTLVLALFALFANWKKWWVPGWVYKDCIDEKNEWKRQALRGTKIAERVVDVHEKQVEDTDVRS